MNKSNSQKYIFKLSNDFLSIEESNVFKDFLKEVQLDNNIWNVFESMFRSGIKGTEPLLLRIYENSDLCGAIIIIRCSKYGRALFNSAILAKLMDLVGIPFYLWIKFGCCMDMMSNPGFVKDIDKSSEIYSAAAEYLRKKSWLTIINDYSANSILYPSSSILPALPHALIDISEYDNVQGYISKHKNIKRKLRRFSKEGGSFEVISDKLSDKQIDSLKKCFISTAEKSVFYLPYQDLYLSSAINTSKTPLNEVYYFIAKLNGKFLGYQAAVKTGTQLNALHGAFDRNRKTNFHAYDLLFVKMTEFAINNNLKSIDFGAVLNVTKQRMVNRTIDMSYFLLSKYKIVQWVFNNFLKITKVQGKEQLKYR